MATHLNGPTRHRAGVLRRFRNALGLLAACLTCSYVAVAAVVSMQRPEIGGGSLRIPVILAGQGDEALAGIQFDLAYDPAQYELVEVTGGAAAQDAGKEVILSQTASGAGRVLVTGFNDNALFDGHVATVVLRPLHAGTSTDSFAMENILASDPDGYGVAIDYEDRYAFPPVPPAAAEADGASEAPDKFNDSDAEVDEAGPSERSSAGEDSAAEDRMAESGVSLDRSPTSGTGVGLVPGDVSEPGGETATATPHARPGTRGVLLEAPTGLPQRIQTGGVWNAPGVAGRAMNDSRATGVAPRPGAPSRLSRDGGGMAEGGPVGVAFTADTPDRTPPRVRLALAAPAGPAFTVSGAAGITDEAGFSGAIAPAVSRGAMGLAALLGVVLFGLLLGLRSLFHERLMRPRWRRER